MFKTWQELRILSSGRERPLLFLLPSPLDGNICVLNFVCFWYYCWYCVQANIGQKVGQFRRIQVAAVRLSPTTRKTGTRGILHICHGRHQRNCICLDFLNLIQWFTVEKKQEQKVFGETDNMRQNNWFLSPLWIFCDLILWASNCQRIEKWISHPWRYFLFFEKYIVYGNTELLVRLLLSWKVELNEEIIVCGERESAGKKSLLCVKSESEKRKEMVAQCTARIVESWSEKKEIGLTWKWKEERNSCTMHHFHFYKTIIASFHFHFPAKKKKWLQHSSAGLCIKSRERNAAMLFLVNRECNQLHLLSWQFSHTYQYINISCPYHSCLRI